MNHEVVMESCPDQRQLAMLPAADDYAFDGFVIKVIVELTKWLWAICSEQEQSGDVACK